MFLRVLFLGLQKLLSFCGVDREQHLMGATLEAGGSRTSDPPEESGGSSPLPLGSGSLHGVLCCAGTAPGSEAMAHIVMRRLGMHYVVPARAA